MASDFLLIIIIPQRFGLQIATYAPGVYAVILFQMVADPYVLCDIPVGHMDITILFLKPGIERPSHDSHKRGIPEGLPPFNVKLYLSLVALVVTGVAQGDQVIRGVPSGFSTLYMVNVQDLIFGFAFAVLTYMAVPP